MSGDYSRIAFDPLQNFSDVLLQQGRPLTDRDWNDQGAAINRRAQAGTLDGDGAVVVSTVTPDAFKIMPGLTIGRGRMYVDGLLADNHGSGPNKWDTALAELYGTNPIPFTKQPHLPGASAPPTTGGPFLIYLDVWQREVTQFEDPDLVEKALGVDTTTRQQTVWQVKWLDQIGATTTCATPLDQIPTWVKETAPSAGRLTTGTGPVANPDPCLVPPAGGYKGLENQLYRVEIHQKGALGAAKFKWSRDNASVEARVTRVIDPSHIVVDSIGKDSVLRFSDGDWIEITDDWRELGGLAGELHKIRIGDGVDDATRTITLDKPLTISLGPTDAQGNLDPLRHARIRRWDQKGKVFAQNGSVHVDLDAATSDGAIPVPAGALTLRLEDGLVVTFSLDPAGGTFHVGDYWVLAARASDASVEILTSAPPRGIHHHYARLAIYTPPSGLEDCRPTKSQEECCCSVVVTPGGDIQAAINSLPAAGGCVCLKAGTHVIPQGLVIARNNVKLTGEGYGTIVRSQQPGPVLTIAGTAIEGIDISMIAFERVLATAPEGAAALAAVVAASGIRRSAITDCRVRATPPQQSIGIQAANTQEFRIARCRIESVATAIFASGLESRSLFLDDNVIELGDQGAQSTAFGIVLQQVVGPCRVAGNALSGLSSGIIVNGQISDSPQPIATDVIVAKNVVVCSPAPGATGDAAGARVFGIDLAAHASIVSHNLVALPAPSAVHTGIRVTGDNVDVIDNQVAALPGPAAPTGAVGGAFTGIQAGETSALTTDVKVAGNFVSGGRIGISAKSATGAIIDGNIVEIAAAQNVVGNGITLVAVKGGQVGGNRINGNGIAIGTTNGTTNRLTGNTLSSGLLGVLIGTEVLPVVAQNRIDGMSAGGILCGAVTGGCEIVENRITSCGFGGNPGAGILVTQINGELYIEANQITDTGLSPDRATIAALAHGISGTLTLEATIENNYVGYTDPSKRPVTNEDRALAMSCLQEVRTTPLGDLGFPIQVLGNKFIGPGKSALVEIQEQAGTGDVRPRFERVTFSNNYCLHYPDYTAGANTPRTVSTVSLFGRFGIVMGNQIKAIRPPATNIPVIASVNFNGMPGPFIGNITSGDVLQHTQFPSPQTGFNLIA